MPYVGALSWIQPASTARRRCGRSPQDTGRRFRGSGGSGGSGGSAGSGGSGMDGAALLHVPLDLSIPQMNSAAGVCRDVGFVRDENNGVAGRMQAIEQAHDLVSGFRVEVAGGLVGEKD